MHCDSTRTKYSQSLPNEMISKKDIIDFLLDLVVSKAIILSPEEQPCISVSRNPKTASQYIQDPSLGLAEFLNKFEGEIIEGRYWKVLRDPNQQYVLKISKRPSSRKSMGIRAIVDFNLIFQYLNGYVPWQLVLEARLQPGDRIFLLLQDFIPHEYSFGAMKFADYCFEDLRNLLKRKELRKSMIDLISRVLTMNQETMAIPDLWGPSNLLVTENSLILVDTNVLYSSAEPAPKSREGYFAIGYFFNEILRIIDAPFCISFKQESNNRFSLQY